MKYIGIDGCKAGWIAWIVSGNEIPTFKVVNTLDELVDDLTGSTTLIDMPIGFSDSLTPDRLCDKAARRFLTSKRGSSVFPVPCREAVYQTDYIAACDTNVEQLDKKFSKQIWGIVPKIRELDELIECHPNLSIRESHPEVVFAALKGEPLTFSKRTQEGKEERLSIIQQLAPQWYEGLSLAISNTKRKDVAIDDIYDAFVLMLVAYYAPQLSTLPEPSDVGGEADVDQNGRVREIVYWNKTR
jgi:predicted RNase H-like nuclease